MKTRETTISERKNKVRHVSNRVEDVYVISVSGGFETIWGRTYYSRGKRRTFPPDRTHDGVRDVYRDGPVVTRPGGPRVPRGDEKCFIHRKRTMPYANTRYTRGIIITEAV